MPKSKAYDAIEITAPKVWEVICKLDPTYKEIPYQDAHEAFLILNFNGKGKHALVPADSLPDDSMFVPGMKIKLVRYYS